jgi:hypothetical protein
VERGNEADVGERGRWLDRLRARLAGEPAAPAVRRSASRFIAPLALPVVVGQPPGVLGLVLAGGRTTVSKRQPQIAARREALQVLSPDVSVSIRR